MSGESSTQSPVPREDRPPAKEASSAARKESKAPLPHPTRRNLHWTVLQAIFRLVFSVWLRYRARGLRNVPPEGGGVVLVNHLSFLDPLLVGLPLSRPVSFLARDSLFRVPLVGWVLRNTYVMPINRDAASTTSIREAVARLKHGFLVGIFPEGTRSGDGAVGEFKPGFLALVRRSGLPVYPVGVAGTHHAMPRGRIALRRRQVCVVFGKPIEVSELAALLKPGREAELVALMRDRVVKCAKEAEEWRSQLEGGAASPRT